MRAIAARMPMPATSTAGCGPLSPAANGRGGSRIKPAKKQTIQRAGNAKANQARGARHRTAVTAKATGTGNSKTAAAAKIAMPAPNEDAPGIASTPAATRHLQLCPQRSRPSAAQPELQSQIDQAKDAAD